MEPVKATNQAMQASSNNEKASTKTTTPGRRSSSTPTITVPTRVSTRKKNVSSTVFYDCELCHERFYSPNTLIKHHQSVHNRVKAVKRDHQPMKATTSPSTSSQLISSTPVNRSDKRGQYFSPDNPRDVAFFSSVSQKIADNLLHHVDGKVEVKPKRTATSTVTSSAATSTMTTTTPSIDLSFFNFPTATTSPKAVSNRLREEEAKSGFMRDSFSLKRSNTGSGTSLLVAVPSSTVASTPKSVQQQSLCDVTAKTEDQPFDLSMPSSRSRQASSENEPLCLSKKSSNQLNLQQLSSSIQKKLQPQQHYICTVCSHRSSSRLSFFEHAMNNHPHTQYTYIIIDSESNIPDHLLCWRHDSPHGLLKACDVSYYPGRSEDAVVVTEKSAEPPTTETVKCTRCSASFTSRASLREHVLECAKQLRKEEKARGMTTQYKGYVTIFEPAPRDDDSEDEKIKKEINSDGTYTTRSGKKRSLDLTQSTSNKKVKGVTFLDNASKLDKKIKLSKNKSKVKSLKQKKKVTHVTLSGQAVEAAMKALSPTIKKKSVDKDKEVESKPQITSIISSNNTLPKINKLFIKKNHICKKCGKKFAFTDSLKKHSQSCTKGVTNESKRLLRQRFKSIMSSKKNPVTKVTEAARKKVNLRSVVAKQSPIKNISEDKSTSLERVRGIKTKVLEDEPSTKEETVDGEFSVKEEDGFIKQVNTLYAFKGSPAQHHSCPHCKRGFTYLANFRKHVQSICPIQLQEEEKKKQLSEKQPRQTPIHGIRQLGSFNLSSDGTKSKFKTFTCDICHKIYFSYLEFMKHRLSHKLSTNNDSKDQASSTSILSEIKTELTSSSSSSNVSIPETVKSAPDPVEQLSIEAKAARDALAQTHLPDRRSSH